MCGVALMKFSPKIAHSKFDTKHPPKKADTAVIFPTVQTKLRISLIQIKRTVTEAIPS